MQTANSAFIGAGGRALQKLAWKRWGMRMRKWDESSARDRTKVDARRTELRVVLPLLLYFVSSLWNYKKNYRGKSRFFVFRLTRAAELGYHKAVTQMFGPDSGPKGITSKMISYTWRQRDCDVIASELRPCHDFEFTCAQTKVCINKDRTCDGYPDCNDASDETSCGEIKARNPLTQKN